MHSVYSHIKSHKWMWLGGITAFIVLAALSFTIGTSTFATSNFDYTSTYVDNIRRFNPYLWLPIGSRYWLLPWDPQGWNTLFESCLLFIMSVIWWASLSFIAVATGKYLIAMRNPVKMIKNIKILSRIKENKPQILIWLAVFIIIFIVHVTHPNTLYLYKLYLSRGLTLAVMSVIWWAILSFIIVAAGRFLFNKTKTLIPKQGNRIRLWNRVINLSWLLACITIGFIAIFYSTTEPITRYQSLGQVITRRVEIDGRVYDMSIDLSGDAFPGPGNSLSLGALVYLDVIGDDPPENGIVADRIWIAHYFGKWETELTHITAHPLYKDYKYHLDNHEYNWYGGFGNRFGDSSYTEVVVVIIGENDKEHWIHFKNVPQGFTS